MRVLISYCLKRHSKSYKEMRRRTLTLFGLLFLIAIPLLQSFFGQKQKSKYEIYKEIEAPFLPQSKNKIALLFFGYYGCADVCTPFLQELSTLYRSKTFEMLRAHVDFYFINLTPRIDPHMPDDFVKYFHPNFHGVYLSAKELRHIDRTFELYFAPSLYDTASLSHSSQLYLLLRDANTTTLISSYKTAPLDTLELQSDIVNLIVTY